MSTHHFIAVATRKIVARRDSRGLLPDNHFSLEFYEADAVIPERTIFPFHREWGTWKWKGSLELIGHLSQYGRFQRPRHGGRRKSPEWVWVPVSFIHKDGKGRREPRTCAVMYSEADAKERWAYLCRLAEEYAWAEQHPPENQESGPWPALQRWPNSFYCYPSTYPGNNSATFVRYLARKIERSPDLFAGIKHPGRRKDPLDVTCAGAMPLHRSLKKKAPRGTTIPAPPPSPVAPAGVAPVV